jgi:hypothetical protein
MKQQRETLSDHNNNNLRAVYSVVLVFFVFRRIHHRGVYNVIIIYIIFN